MRAGQLRSKAQIFVPTTAIGADGSIEVAEDLLGTFYCSVRDYNKDEKDRSGNLVAYTMYRLMFRYQPNLRMVPANARIVVNGSLELQVISSSHKEERSRMIEVLAEARR